MQGTRIAVAGAAIAIAGSVIGVAAGQSAFGTPTAARPASLAGFTRVAHGPRRGVILSGSVPGIGQAAVYVPWRAQERRDLPVVYVLCRRGASTFARTSGLAPTADQLVWDGTTPPFIAVVAQATGETHLQRLMAWTQAVLPVSRDRAGRTLAGVGPVAGSVERIATGDPDLVELAESLTRGGRKVGSGAPLRAVHVRFHAAPTLADDLVYALQPPGARSASRAARTVIPAGFAPVLTGPDGGTIWQGLVPSAVVPGLTRASLVYLPPDVDPSRRYPLVVLLHGLRGSPYSFAGGLRLAAAVDPLIAAHRLRPFIAVMPPAGLTRSFDGEWTGVWERYVVDDVVPWASSHLPVQRDAAGRVIAGFSAGAYGAVDIALRHLGLFGVAEAWSGYFEAPHDGSLQGASRAELAAHSPATLVARDRADVRRLGLRFLVSAGLRERTVLHATRSFGAELARLQLPARVLITPGRHDGRQWHAVLGPGLSYALPPGRSGR
jgi:enterochelin esterase-like enzyme